MKKILAVVVFVALGYACYTKWSEWQASKQTNSSQTQEQTPPVAPVAESTPRPQAPPQQHLAPANTYYLTQGVPVTTDTGIVALPAGTKVTLVSTTVTGMRVTDGTNQFDVDASQVTNDLDVAGRFTTLAQPVSTSQNAAPVNPAPDSTYYLLQSISVTTDSGIDAVAPGTKVKVISSTADAIHVTDGTHQFDVTPAQITSDLATAQQVVNSYNTAQAQLDQARAQQEALALQQRQAQAQQTPQPQQVAAPPAVQPPQQSQVDAINSQIAKLTAELTRLTDGHPYIYPETVHSRQVQIESTEAAIANLRAQLGQPQ